VTEPISLPLDTARHVIGCHCPPFSMGAVRTTAPDRHRADAPGTVWAPAAPPTRMVGRRGGGWSAHGQYCYAAPGAAPMCRRERTPISGICIQVGQMPNSMGRPEAAVESPLFSQIHRQAFLHVAASCRQVRREWGRGQRPEKCLSHGTPTSDLPKINRIGSSKSLKFPVSKAITFACCPVSSCVRMI